MNILVLTDFSDIAERGLQSAVALAKQLGGAEILLLNTELPPEGTDFTATGDIYYKADTEEDAFMVALIKKNRARLQELEQKYSAEGLKVSPFMQVGPMQEIVDTFIHKHKVDLIVMGTSGENTMEEYFVGNHTEQVISVSNVPVLSVKVTDRPVQANTILVATDMEDDAYPGLAHIRTLAEHLNSNLHLVHVTNGSVDKHVKQLDRYAKEHNLRNYTPAVIEDNDTEDGLKRYAAKVGADMIAVITHGRTGLSSLLSHSVAHDIIRGASVPVLTVNMKKIKK